MRKINYKMSGFNADDPYSGNVLTIKTVQISPFRNALFPKQEV